MAGAVKSIVPALGVLVNVAMYLAPVRTVYLANKAQELGELNPIPLVVTLINSTTWACFALAAKNPFVLVANECGVLAGVYFTASCFSLRPAEKVRRTMLAMLLLAAVVFFAIGTAGAWGGLDQEQVKSIWGIAGNVVSILFYAAPLSVMVQVIQSRNSASIHLPQNVMNAANAALWTTYGLSTNELLIALPNIPGLACSAAALLLCFIFPREPRCASGAGLELHSHFWAAHGSGMHAGQWQRLAAEEEQDEPATRCQKGVGGDSQTDDELLAVAETADGLEGKEQQPASAGGSSGSSTVRLTASSCNSAPMSLFAAAATGAPDGMSFSLLPEGRARSAGGGSMAGGAGSRAGASYLAAAPSLEHLLLNKGLGN